jgi:hypothetical protein
MIVHVYTVACEPIAEDQFNRARSFRPVEQIAIKSREPLSILPVPFTLLTLWFNTGNAVDTAIQRARFVGPNREMLRDFGEASLVVPFGSPGRLFGQIPDIPFCGNGVYWLEVSAKKGKGWTVAARVPLLVKVSTMAAPTKPH